MTGPSSGAGPRRVALFQPLLAHYRVGLFAAFDQELGGGLTIFTVAAGASTFLDAPEVAHDLEVAPARTWRLGPVWWVPRTLAEVWSRRSDVVVLSWNSRQAELLPALLLGRWRGVPVVLWGHGLGQARSLPVVALRRWQARLASVVMTYSEAGRREVEGLVRDTPVRVLLNTTGRPAPTEADGLSEVRHRIAFVGRLLAHKHVDRLLAALAEVRRTGLLLELDVVGDGPERAALADTAARLGLDEAITWHGQVAGWDDVRALLGRCDLVVLPGHAGLAVVDAFAASRGALVVDDPALNPPEAELVVEGDTGHRYAPPTAAGLADHLQRIYADGDLPAVSRRAGELYRRDLRLETAAATFGRVLEEAVGRGSSRRRRISPSPGR